MDNTEHDDDFYMSERDREILDELKLYEQYERERDEKSYQEYLNMKKSKGKSKYIITKPISRKNIR